MADNFQDSKRNAEDLKNILGDILFEQRDLTDAARQYTKAVFDSNIQAQSAAKAFKDIANSTRDINREISDIVSGEKSIEEIQNKIVNHQSKEKALLIEAEQALKKIGFSHNDISKALNEQEGIYQLLESTSLNLSNSQFELAMLYAQQLDTLQDQNKEMEELAERAANIEGGLGFTRFGGAFDEIIKKAGGSKLSQALGIADATKQARMLSSNLTAGGTKMISGAGKLQVIGKFFSVVLSNVAKALGPITLIVELLKGIGRADQETTELGKSMALTKGEATLFRENLAEAARDSGNMAVTSEKMVKSFTELNKQLGFINNFTLDTLVTMTKLTEQVGLSAEEAGALVTLSESRGKNAEDEYKSVLATSYQLQRQSGIQFDLREILKDIGKISGQLRANLGANPKAMAEAVTLAKQLGGSLNEIKSVSSAILDFESSIAAELEAELLTGKEINLERARLAALNGDIADLTREIASQVGTFTEFSKMNVIQQDALAKSFGLQSDQLSDMLFKQQVMGRSAKELKAAGEDDLARMVEQQTMQDKFNQTVEKLKSVFADVGQAFMPVLQVLGFALSIVGLLVGMVTDLLSLLKGDTDFSATTAAFGTLGSQLGIEGGGGGSGYNSGGARPAASRRGSDRSESNRPIYIEPKIYMDDRQLSKGMDMNNYAVGS